MKLYTCQFLLFGIYSLLLLSCQNPTKSSKEQANQKGVWELVEEHNKAMLLKNYDLNLKTEEIDFYFSKFGQNNVITQKEWMIKVINYNHVEIENKLKKDCQLALEKINQFKIKVDSLKKMNSINEEELKYVNENIGKLEKLIDNNKNYINSIN